MHGQRSKMEENGYKFIDWKELEVDGFNAYKTIYVDSETQIKNAEFVTLILEENSYVAGYISHIDFDENRKEKFLNSILVNKENSPSQYIGEPQAYKRGYVFGKYAFRISLFILVIWGIRRLFKK